MTTLEQVEKIRNKAAGSLEAAEYLFDGVRLLEREDFGRAHEMNMELRVLASRKIREVPDAKEAGRYFEIVRKTMLFAAPHDFDSYLQYIEWARKPEIRFYLPRRHYLLRVVQAYQEVLDGKLDLLSIALIKRAGKSQLGINFTNMVSGRSPNGSTLMEGAGDALVKSLYSGCLEILQSPAEYLHYDVFPDGQLVGTNADIKTINLGKKSRFPTVMCRSVDANQVGLSEATNLLYLDDCVEGYEEAKNRARLDEKWAKMSADVIGRRVGAPIVICGTRYSIYDPMARLEEKADELGWRWKKIVVPALDPVTDESNYEHVREGKRIFTTEYLRNERKLISAEQWESEFQQEPFEAKGLVFPEAKLNRLFKLPPDRDPDAIIAVCDTAERGSDSVMLPIAYLYGSDVFVPDCVFDNAPPDITKPQCAKMLMKHKVSVATFESNNAGEYYARDVEEIMRKEGGRTSIRTKRTISNKHTRIEMASDGIIKNFYFLDESLYARGSQYWNMMRELTSYTRTGKSPHDDAPDGLSLLENELRNLAGSQVNVFKRPF